MLRALFILAVSIFAVSAKAGDMPHIAEWPNQILPLKVGDHTPDAILWTGNGDPIHLRKLLKKKPTVLLFYQGNWSPECSDQLADIQKTNKKLKELGFQVIAVSPDSPYRLRKMQKKFDFPLLSDYHLETAMSFGIVYRLNEKQAMKYKKKYGADLRKMKGETGYNLPVPGVFVVDTTGKIEFTYVNPDRSMQLSMGLLFEAAKMLKAHRSTEH